MQLKGKTSLQKDTWNDGIWYQIPDFEMKSFLEEYKASSVERHFGSSIEVIQKPRAEFLGNVDLNNQLSYAKNWQVNKRIRNIMGKRQILMRSDVKLLQPFAGWSNFVVYYR